MILDYLKILVSKPSAEMVGGMTAITAAQSAKILGTRNPFCTNDSARAFMALNSIGTQAGAYAYDFGNRLLRSLMDLPNPDLKEASSQFLYDTMMNAMFTGGAASMGPIFNHSKAFIGKNIFGIDPTKKNLAKLAEISDTYGMPLGIIQASNMPFWKAYSKVIGVLPWVGTPFGKQQTSRSRRIKTVFR